MATCYSCRKIHFHTSAWNIRFRSNTFDTFSSRCSSSITSCDGSRGIRGSCMLPLCRLHPLLHRVELIGRDESSTSFLRKRGIAGLFTVGYIPSVWSTRVQLYNVQFHWLLLAATHLSSALTMYHRQQYNDVALFMPMRSRRNYRHTSDHDVQCTLYLWVCTKSV